MPQLSPGAVAHLAAWALFILVFCLPILILLPSYASYAMMLRRAPYALGMVQTWGVVGVVSVYLIRGVYPIPCVWINWIAGIGLFLVYFCVLARYIYLGGQFWTSAYKLAQGRQRDRIGLSAEVGALNSSGAEVREDIEAGEMSLRLGEQAKKRLRLLYMFSMRNVVRLGCILGGLQIVGLVVVQAIVKSTLVSNATAACPVRFYEWIPTMVVALLVTGLMLPAAVMAISGVRDAFGIRIELDIALGIFIICTVCQTLMMTLASRVPFFQRAMDVVGHQGYLWIFCVMAIHFVTLYLPLIETWYASVVDAKRMSEGKMQPPPFRRADKYGMDATDTPNRPSFERILLDDPKLLREFRLFSVREFTVERVLFFERYKRARIAAEDTTQPTPGRAWREQYKKIYFDFLRPNAEMSLSDILSNKVSLQVRMEFRADTFDADVLDAAAHEIWNVLWYETYPRFLLHYRNTYRADMGKQMRWGNKRRRDAKSVALPLQ